MAGTPGTPRKTRARKGKGTDVSPRLGWPDKFLSHLRDLGAIAPAARASGVGRSTVYRQIEADPEFAADIDRVLDECVEEVEGTLFQMALNPVATTDRIFYLKSRKPQVYGDKLRQDQIDQIRREAREATLAEIRGQLMELTPEARRIVMAAMAQATQGEITP